MLEDRFDSAFVSGRGRKTGEVAQMEADQQSEVVENKEEFHPMATQYVQEVRTFLGALEHYQEHGWKGIQKDWKFPEKAAHEIAVMGHMTEIVLQMTAEELIPPKGLDTSLLHKVVNAPVATGDGRFLKKTKGAKGEMREVGGGLVPALRIDDVPEHADEAYLRDLGEIAQLDLLLRDIYSRFLLDVSRRLSYPDVHGTYALKHRLLHDLMYPDSVNKKNVPAPFFAEEYTEDEKKRVNIGSTSESQLDKFLQAEPFKLLENNPDDPENRTLYIDNVYEIEKHRTERRLSIGVHLQSYPHETYLPKKPEKIFSLDYVRQAASEIRAEALGRAEQYPDEDIKLGVKYRTDPASGVRYPRGGDSKEEKANLRMAVDEFEFIKERMAKFLSKRLNGDEEGVSAVEEPAEKKPAVFESVVDEPQPKKETVADKLARVSTERDTFERERDSLSVELTEAKKTAEDLRHSVDAVTVENTGLKDSIERLNAVLELSKGEAKEAKQDAGLRERELLGKLRDIQLALMKAGFGDRAVAMGKAVRTIDEILGN